MRMLAFLKTLRDLLLGSCILLLVYSLDSQFMMNIWLIFGSIACVILIYLHYRREEN